MNKFCVAVITTLYKGDDVSSARKALESLRLQCSDTLGVNIYLHVDGLLLPEQESLILEFNDIFFKVIRSEVNVGLAMGLNLLINNLGSESYIFRMDLDDISLPGRFQAQIDYMESHREIMICGCRTQEIDANDAIINKRDYPLNHNDIVARIHRGLPMLHPTFCYRASVFDDGLRYPNRYLTEDLGIIFEAINRGYKLGNIPDRLFSWRISDDFFYRRNAKRSFVEFKVYCSGIYSIWGVSYRYFFPAARLAFRFLPVSIVRMIYLSPFRSLVLNDK